MYESHSLNKITHLISRYNYDEETQIKDCILVSLSNTCIKLRNEMENVQKEIICNHTLLWQICDSIGSCPYAHSWDEVSNNISNECQKSTVLDLSLSNLEHHDNIQVKTSVLANDQTYINTDDNKEDSKSHMYEIYKGLIDSKKRLPSFTQNTSE
jgi:hypothetical protein